MKFTLHNKMKRLLACPVSPGLSVSPADGLAEVLRQRHLDGTQSKATHQPQPQAGSSKSVGDPPRLRLPWSSPRPRLFHSPGLSRGQVSICRLFSHQPHQDSPSHVALGLPPMPHVAPCSPNSEGPPPQHRPPRPGWPRWTAAPPSPEGSERASGSRAESSPLRPGSAWLFRPCNGSRFRVEMPVVHHQLVTAWPSPRERRGR